MKNVILFLFLILVFGCSTKYAENEEDCFPVLTGKYLGQNEPKLSPEIFAPNIVSTGMSEINACFSPDYKEFFYSIIMANRQFVILSMSFSDGKWSEPEVASFSGKYSDGDPFITLDGKWLYFVSKRPIDSTQSARNNWDIWRLEKIAGKWSNLERLDSTINSDQDDIYPSLTNQGTLYFSSGRDGNNDRDIYIAKSNADGFEPSVKLSDTINSHWAGDVYISPEEDYMIFRSFGREEGNGLYISFNNKGLWDFPIRMDEEINMTGWELCPIVSPDQKYFFFTSNHITKKEESTAGLSYNKMQKDFKDSYSHPGMGKNDVYWVDIEIIEKYRNNRP
jgi:hypothetical protein